MKPANTLRLFSSLTVASLPLLVMADQGGDSTISAILALWPYIVIVILLLMAFLWYQQIRLWLRQRKGQSRRHTTRGNQLTTLVIITIFALALLAVPQLVGRYDTLFTTQPETTMDPANRTELILIVEGMTCTGCENAIQHRVAELPGVESVTADHMNNTAIVVFDRTKTGKEAIAQTIEDTGYKVAD